MHRTVAISKISRRKYICNSICIISRFEKIESLDEEAHAIVPLYEGLKRGRIAHSIIMYNLISAPIIWLKKL